MKDPKRSAITEFQRIEQYIADVASRIDVIRHPIEGWEFRQGRHLAPGEYEYDGPWRPYRAELIWGGEDVTAWFRATLAVPESMAGREVVLRFVPGGEGILSVDGVPSAGFDFSHNEYRLAGKAEAGREYLLELECYFRDAPDDSIRGDVRKTHQFRTAELVVRDDDLRGLYCDLCAALELARAARETRPDISARLMKTLRDAVAIVDPYARDAEGYREKALAAREFLVARLYDTGHDRPPGTLWLVGHSHVDLLFVWPYRESVRKNLRTNLIAGELMKRYEPYIFAQSQAKLFADMKEYHPEAFEQVRALVAAGSYEPIGDMWVECDCNIPCGEALVRQVLYGKAFFEKEFGTRSSVCWLPDVFGMAASMPQILVQAGFRLFCSAKYSVWHDTNEFPHGTFWWEGIDGTRILAHLPPTHFIGRVDAESLLRQWEFYRQKDEAPHVIYTYGYGDGGGGPTEVMLENALRFGRMDGMPAMRFSTAEAFAEHLVNTAGELPVWADELYLEMHRGVFTTKGELKRKNRRAEAALRSAEILSSAAALSAGGAPPSGELEAMWKTLCECHFHDAVTGTHCADAGSELERAYDSLLARAEAVSAAACAEMAASGPAGKKTLFNLTGAATAGHVIWRHDDAADPGNVPSLESGGHVLETQRLADGRLLTFVPELPALGHKVFSVTAGDDPSPVPFEIARDSIRSPHYALHFDGEGRIESLVDAAAGREIFAEPGNRLDFYEDKPGRFEAWEISKDYESRPVDEVVFLGIEDGEAGPLAASKVLRWRVGRSPVRQEVFLYAHSRRIDFHTEIDWREEHKLLRVSFPFDLLARSAAYEIPFGVLERPTRPTSPYDEAKFEVPFQRWFDVAEHGYGVGVLNDGRYGGRVTGGVASISLLKSPRFPDPTSDLGRHEFTYSLLPHEGDWRPAGVFAEAVLLNNPLRLFDGAAETEGLEYVKLSRPGIAVEAFKRAEDGDGWILRLVDYFGQRGAVAVALPFELESAEACTVTEQPGGEEASLAEGGFVYECRPFAISTFRLRFGS